MTKILKLLTIGILFTSLLFIPLPVDIKAGSLCPSYMSPDSRECLDYLRNQLSKINNQQSQLQRKLANEEYQQLSLTEKINYINGQIGQTQKVIDTLEVQVAAQDVEIKILSKELQVKEDHLSTLYQEMQVLEDNVNKRITESYKYSFIGALELFLDTKNIDSVLRKTKYLIETREKDKISLEEYNTKTAQLQEEEEKLTSERADLQQKRNDIEEEKSNLVEERRNLDSQKAEKDRLLAQSKQREREMLAQLDSFRTKQSSIDNAIMEYISKHGDQMANYGWVSKGTWIGKLKEGPSGGCSTGTHLHFSIDKVGSSVWNGCGKVNPFSGYLTKGPDYWLQSGSWKYYYIRSGSFRVPLGGNVIVTSLSHTPYGSCTGTRYAIDITSTLWTNIPVYAAHEGNLWKGTDSCGDRYAVVENSKTGIKTAYFHLQ